MAGMLIAIALAAATGAAPAPAPAAAADRSFAAPISVYDVRPITDGAVIAAGLLAVAVPYALSAQLITPRCPCSPGEVNSFDRHVIGNHNAVADVASDVTAGAALVLPAVFDFLDVGASRVWLEDAAVFSEVMAVNGAFVTLSKYTVQRPLPRVYAGQDPALARSPGGYRSFYSGHTSLTFAALDAAAYTLDLRHHLGAWPWIAAQLVGASVAAERVAAGRHFYTDVIVAAAAGSLFGTLIPWLHEQHPQAQVSVAPQADGARLSLAAAF